MNADLVLADWGADVPVVAFTTTRSGGGSTGTYASLNLAAHVGDDPAAVAANRARLGRRLPAQPNWLEQVHGCAVTDARLGGCADAVYSADPGEPCAVLTADCLPVLLCTADGTEVAAAHAGWRGLAAGVLEATIRKFRAPAGAVLAWLGPAIGQDAFEVGPEVRAGFCATDPGAALAFRPGRDDRWHCDLYALARRRLLAAGVGAVHGGGWCTYRESERFFSFRRDGASGRMASIIWRRS